MLINRLPLTGCPMKNVKVNNTHIPIKTCFISMRDNAAKKAHLRKTLRYAFFMGVPINNGYLQYI